MLTAFMTRGAVIDASSLQPSKPSDQKPHLSEDHHFTVSVDSDIFHESVFEDGSEIYEQKNESPATLIEMPQSESGQPLLSQIHRKNSKSLIEFDEGSKKEVESYSLPQNYEYPEMVKSLKSVYKELFITSSLYALNIVSAVGIVLVNKFIYSYYKFPHGLVLTLFHFVLTSVGLQILAALKCFAVKPVKLHKILPLSVSFCSYVVLTNLSLQYNSGTFYQVQKSGYFKNI